MIILQRNTGTNKIKTFFHRMHPRQIIHILMNYQVLVCAGLIVLGLVRQVEKATTLLAS